MELTDIGDLLDERHEEKGGVEDDCDNSGFGAHVDSGSNHWDKSRKEKKVLGEKKCTKFSFRHVLFNVVTSYPGRDSRRPLALCIVAVVCLSDYLMSSHFNCTPVMLTSHCHWNTPWLIPHFMASFYSKSSQKDFPCHLYEIIPNPYVTHSLAPYFIFSLYINYCLKLHHTFMCHLVFWLFVLIEWQQSYLTFFSVSLLPRKAPSTVKDQQDSTAGLPGSGIHKAIVTLILIVFDILSALSSLDIKMVA